MITREQIIRVIAFESRLFDTDAEIRANRDHMVIQQANRAADRILKLFYPDEQGARDGKD